ncbi:hypothetical protein [Nocardiopsis lambiniae]|uniref:Lipoprotein n=1 Tax=Nocardiopsis lambiniae TaxID=3075539 RepID=A0ABU2M4A1_9ACTN|nr:hypothetical protein [Nocardiopsis sp. DSM 44743]MDT0327480.1 hypothetical protein [Nocardiopsis sp. DSM 44743]
MVITPRRTVAALAAVALTLTVASCSGGNPAEGPRPDAAAGDDRVRDIEGTSPAPRPTEVEEVPSPPPSAGTEEAAPPAEQEELPSLSARVDGADIVVIVGPVERTGDELVDLTVTVHVVSGYAVATALVGPLDESELIDTEHHRVHRVARDRDGVCLCSRVEEAPLSMDHVMVLSATFAAPPREVTEMNVRLPLGGTFTGVPVV